MATTEVEKIFLEKMSEYLVSLPFDLKTLQEAVTDPDLSRDSRLLAVGTIVHTILPQDGELPGRYVDDVLLVRATLQRIATDPGADAFKERFSDVYEHLDEEVELFATVLGDLWPWLTSKLDAFPKQVYKGKKSEQFVDDEENAAFLYEQGLEFETNYQVTDEMVQNRVRRADALIDVLSKKRGDDAKKI
jgi:hypothetical protein